MNRTNSIRANIIWNTGGSLVFLGCQWLMTVLVVRLSSGYDAAGSLAVAMAVSNVFAPIGLYKIRSYQVSDICGEISSSEYVAFRIVTIGIALVVSMGYSLATCSPANLPVVFAYLVFRSVEVFVDVLHGVDQFNGRMDYCGKSMAIRGVLSLFAFAIVLSVTNDLFCAVVAMSFVVYPIVLLDWRWAAQFDRLIPSFSVDKILHLTMTCFPAVIGMACSYCVTTVARQYLGIVDGDAALGIYASVCTPVLIVQAGASYAYAPLLGSFADAYLRENEVRFVRLIRKVAVSIVLLSAAAFVLFLLIGPWFIGLVFGRDLVPYSYLLFAALICTSLTAFVSFLNDICVVIREMWGTLVANVISLIVVVPAVALCVQWFDMNGVSIAISLSYFIGILILLAFVLRRLKTVSRV